jgi:hypothetical protein
MICSFEALLIPIFLEIKDHLTNPPRERVHHQQYFPIKPNLSIFNIP